MDERYDCNKMDEIMLPGFRFHPTDEELVGFYLKRKIQHQPLSIELIEQLDIYKYDPWDLPKVATTGEKEWYFYCPRDRKYRNSARPNRVTGAGFWKATGTDRPIYSSEGNKCIGLKKSLVFYTGRAAKGIKTDWMMHEFRLPTLTNSTTPKRFGERNLPAEDSWAICRIFKKTNTMAQRALSHSWVSPLPETTRTQILDHGINSTQFASENTSCLSEAGSAIQFYSDIDIQQSSSTSFSPLPVNPTISKPCLLPTLNGDLLDSFISSFDMSGHGTCTVDVASMLLNFPPALLGENEKGMNDINFSGTEQAYEGFTITSPQGMQGHTDFGEEETWLKHNLNCLNTFQVNDQLGSVRPLEFHSVLPPSLPDTWRSNLPWDSLPFPCEISASYSANKCYT